MKKLLVILGMIFLSSHALFCQSLDYRQVIFGNNYEQIQEINADEFFAQYPQAKEVKKYGKGSVSWYDNIYFRVYEQKIGSITFYRIVITTGIAGGLITAL